MLDKIGVNNYKAFEHAEIPLKPITVLLGANSVGKSSIIQLLLLLQQTAKEDLKSYKSALKLYGGYVNIGDASNLYRKKDTSNPLVLSFTLKSKELKDYLKQDFINGYLESITNIPKFIPIKGFLDLRNLEIKNKRDYEIYINKFITLINKDSKSKDYIEEVKWFLNHRANIKINDLNLSNKQNLIKVYDLLDKTSKNIDNDEFEYVFKLKFEKNKLLVDYLCFSHNGKTIIDFNNSNKVNKLSSDFCQFTDIENSEILHFFNESNTIFNCFAYNSQKETNSTITTIIISILSFALNILKGEFSESRINYVSPLRAHPKRYYMLDKAKVNITLDTLDGDAIADVLKENSSLKTKVNNWLKNFNLSVNVEEFKEVVHHLKVKQNDLSLDITDVGFGISQILPVIIQGFLSENGSTTIIEQPEIHLHPKMQADLADLFIDIIKNSKNKKLIIETHSEYLLKRLRRRISEDKISPDDVSICLFNPQTLEKGAFIENLEIQEKGYFEWPIDFYGGDLYDDTVEFLKNQN